MDHMQQTFIEIIAYAEKLTVQQNYLSSHNSSQVKLIDTPRYATIIHHLLCQIKVSFSRRKLS